jgi:hypothetical protein
MSIERISLERRRSALCRAMTDVQVLDVAFNLTAQFNFSQFHDRGRASERPVAIEGIANAFAGSYL